MNMLVVAIGSYGDVLPLVGLARELKKRGHPVTFLTNDHFAGLAQRAGLDFVALGAAAEYDSIASHPDLWHPQKGWQVIGSAAVSDGLRNAYSILREQIIPENTVMVSSTLGLPFVSFKKHITFPRRRSIYLPVYFNPPTSLPKCRVFPYPSGCPFLLSV